MVRISFPIIESSFRLNSNNNAPTVAVEINTINSNFFLYERNEKSISSCIDRALSHEFSDLKNMESWLKATMKAHPDFKEKLQEQKGSSALMKNWDWDEWNLEPEPQAIVDTGNQAFNPNMNMTPS